MAHQVAMAVLRRYQNRGVSYNPGVPGFRWEVRQMKPILIQIVEYLADLAASVDALEAELVSNGELRKDTVRNRFRNHKEIVEGHLASLRMAISGLPD